jgi:hypothetical protein
VKALRVDNNNKVPGLERRVSLQDVEESITPEHAHKTAASLELRAAILVKEKQALVPRLIANWAHEELR